MTKKILKQDETEGELQAFIDRAQKLIRNGLIPRSNTKVDKELVHMKEDEKTDLLLAAKKDIFVSVLLGSKDPSASNPNVTIRCDPLDSFDMVVLQAAYSLILEGNEYITPAMIYRKMIGTDYTSPVNANGENIKKILVSMEKLSYKKIEIEWSEDALGAFPGLNKIKAFGIKGYLLSFEEIYVEVNYGGKRFRERRYLFHAYKNGHLPPLLNYAIGLGQISFIPKILLNDGIRSTPDVMVLRYKIAEFITALKSPNFNDKSGFITYFTLFENCGFNINPDPNDDEIKKDYKKRARKKKKPIVKTILEYYKKIEYIDSFEEETRNGQTGIVIQCKKEGLLSEKESNNKENNDLLEIQDENERIKEYVKKELGLEFRLDKLKENPSFAEVEELVAIVKKNAYLSNIKNYFDWIWTSRKEIKEGKYDDFTAFDGSGKNPVQVNESDYRAERERYYAELRRKAEQKAEYYQEKADKDPEYHALNVRYKGLKIQAAKAAVEQSSDEGTLRKSVVELRDKINDCLNRLGIDPNSLTPQYRCSICLDTGFEVSSGKSCSCYPEENHSICVNR